MTNGGGDKEGHDPKVQPTQEQKPQKPKDGTKK